MTNVSCRQAAVAVAVVLAAVAAIAGGLLGRWALVGGAAAGGALYLAVVCARGRPRSSTLKPGPGDADSSP